MAKNEIHGIAVRPDRLEYTTLEQQQERWDVTGSKGISLPKSDALAADSLRPLAAQLHGPVSLGLPADGLLLRVVDLPSDDADELEGMVELQVDKFSPFPTDQLLVTYERLAEVNAGARVLIVAAQREQVEALGTTCRDAGLHPRWVDAQVLGWWRLFKEEGKLRTTGREAVLLVESGDTTLIVIEDGVPLLFRSLGGESGMEKSEFAQVVVEETEYALTSLETEWGGGDTPAFSLWHEGDPPKEVVASLAEAFQIEPSLHSLESLPPVSEGLALRAIQREEGMADLAPAEWEEAERAGKTRRVMLMATGSLLLVWLIVVTAFMIALGTKRSHLADRRAHLTSLEVPAAEVKEIRDKAQFLELYRERKDSALENLRAISLAMPAGLDLSALSYTKGGTVNVRGSAASRSPIFQFNESLQKLDLYDEVKIEKVDVDRRSGKSIFRLTAVMKEDS